MVLALLTFSRYEALWHTRHVNVELPWELLQHGARGVGQPFKETAAKGVDLSALELMQAVEELRMLIVGDRIQIRIAHGMDGAGGCSLNLSFGTLWSIGVGIMEGAVQAVGRWILWYAPRLLHSHTHTFTHARTHGRMQAWRT